MVRWIPSRSLICYKTLMKNFSRTVPVLIHSGFWYSISCIFLFFHLTSLWTCLYLCVCVSFFFLVYVQYVSFCIWLRLCKFMLLCSCVFCVCLCACVFMNISVGLWALYDSLCVWVFECVYMRLAMFLCVIMSCVLCVCIWVCCFVYISSLCAFVWLCMTAFLRVYRKR